MGKIKVVMNKPVYFAQTILDLSKIVMHEFHYDYMKPKYGENLKLFYMDTDLLVYHIKTEDFYEDSTKDVETRFNASGYEKRDARPLPIGLNKKVKNRLNLTEENKKQEPCRQHSAMSLIKYQNQYLKNLDNFLKILKNQILPNNDTQKSGSNLQKSTQNNGTSPYHDICKLTPRGCSRDLSFVVLHLFLNASVAILSPNSLKNSSFSSLTLIARE